MEDTALILVIEGRNNKGDLVNKYNTGNISFDYETEAISCVSMWRTNAGIYKDIPIYAINVNGNPPAIETKIVLKNLGVTYIEEFCGVTMNFPCGYFNTPFGCMILESEFVKENNLIHIDLDMNVLRPLDEKLFKMKDGCLCKIAINEWRPTDNFPVGTFEKYPFEIATNFIYSKKENQFYRDWWDNLETYISVKESHRPPEEQSIFEERICDVMYFDSGYPFCFFGSGYQINHEEQINKDAYFLHCHLEHKDRFNRLLKLYLKERNSGS